METYKQNPDFLHIGKKILKWYKTEGRDLPFRKTKNPYQIWICEIIFQQTRIEQGINHYNKFIERFPNVKSLLNAETEEILLYWKGLGYYSRALNIHRAAKQIQEEFNGNFPEDYHDILKLSGIGKYTAAAISSICFGERIPAVDGNFYRVLGRIFADDFDISNSKAYSYFSELAYKIMPQKESGLFNQAMMDLGSEICKPKKPKCDKCPVLKDCMAYSIGRIAEFPVKAKKVVAKELAMTYYFVEFQHQFLIKQRGDDFIWKKLFEFPKTIPPNFEKFQHSMNITKHKLTHKNLTINFVKIVLESKEEFLKFANENDFQIIDFEASFFKSFPKPLENYLNQQYDSGN